MQQDTLWLLILLGLLARLDGIGGGSGLFKGIDWEPQSKELQEYSRKILGTHLPRRLCSCDIPTILLGSPTLGSPFSSLYLRGENAS